MSDILKVAAVQLDIAWGDSEENLRRAAAAIDALPAGVDVIMLPEMFSTGFICDPQEALASGERMDGRVLNTLRKWARDYSSAICGSLIVKVDDRVFNRGFFIEPSGDEYFYDKHHLFSFSGEDQAYSRGESAVPVFRYRGWNIAMAVCFDLRFPAWLRNRHGEYDLLLIMANWPDSRAYAWKHLLIARAIENQAYVAGCNRGGSDRFGEYSGTSMIIDPKGQPVHETVDGSVVLADLSRSSLQAFREKFPVYMEGDDFIIS